MNRRNIVLTGPPRSGTTLSCYLLSKAPNCVALNEPIRPARLRRFRHDHAAAAESVERFFRQARRQVRKRGTAPSKLVGGEASPETYAAPDEAAQGRRRSLLGRGELAVEKPLEGRFWLVVKSPAMFTVLLPELVERFECSAVVRNPLSVLASAMSVQGEGDDPRDTAPAAQMLDPGFARRIVAEEDILGRRIALLDWCCERYVRHLPPERVVRYEDVVASGGKALAAVVPTARKLEEPLESKNLNPLYGRDRLLRAGERLLASEGAYWRFYSREEVESLLAAM